MSIEREVLDHPRFALTGIGEGAPLCAFVRDRWGKRSFRRVVELGLSAGRQLDEGRYKELAAALRREIAVEWGNAMTLVKLGRSFIRNAVRNLVLLQGVPDFKDFSLGKAPALVLGAGPSLDGFLDALEKSGLAGGGAAARPFRIICVDTCIPVLLERGIIPDLAVILESQHWNLRDFIGARDSRIAAAVDLSAYPATAGVLGGKVLPFFTPWTTLRLFDRLKGASLLPEILPPLGSVGLSAVELARRLGGGAVVCSGIDFSFTLDRGHARSSPAHLAGLAGQNRLKGLMDPAAAFREGVFTAVSKAGLPVRSNPAMRNYRSLFEQEFSADPRIRDLNGTGLPLGLKTLSTGEALELLAAGTGGARPGAEGPGKPEETGIREELPAFIKNELAMLEELRDILTGSRPPEKLDALLDGADYLWAHFPDCAGSGKRPGDRGFLKRVRVEIDPFIRLWHLTLGELRPPVG
jgi:hypothetical protein